AANVKLSGFMLQQLGYFLPDADPVLIYTIRFNDFFFTAKILRKWQTDRLSFFFFGLAALIRDDFFCGLRCHFFLFWKHIQPVKIKPALQRILWYELFAYRLPQLTTVPRQLIG